MLALRGKNYLIKPNIHDQESPGLIEWMSLDNISSISPGPPHWHRYCNILRLATSADHNLERRRGVDYKKEKPRVGKARGN